jgi:transposase
VIRDLYSQGLSISKISEITGHDRKTVKKCLRIKAAPELQKRKTRPRKLDPYNNYIMQKLSEGSYTVAHLSRGIKEVVLMVERSSLKIL